MDLWVGQSLPKNAQRLRPKSWLKAQQVKTHLHDVDAGGNARNGFGAELLMDFWRPKRISCFVQMFTDEGSHAKCTFWYFWVRTWLSLRQSQLPWEQKFVRSSCFHNHVSPPRISSKVSARKLAEVKLNGIVPPTIIWGRNWIMSMSTSNW